jgi:hypothetical protein
VNAKSVDKQAHLPLADLLDRIVAFIRRFVALPPAQLRVVALWVMHTWAFDAADTTPYLHISSAEKQSGKTQLLEVLSTLVAKPWLTGRASAAVLPRKIEAQCPTLLLDESDTAFSGPKEYSETLRGILNTGYRHSGSCSVCVGQGAKIGYKDFKTFCPKAIAGIGELPDTVLDRSIPVRMKRRARNEPIERFRLREVKDETLRLRNEMEKWANDSVSVLRQARPSLPEELNDRQQDVAEPLLAIADSADGKWPEQSRSALLELLTGHAAEDQSLGTMLLADIQSVFEERSVDRISSHDLANSLAQMEGRPWATVEDGYDLSPNKLAHLLAPFEIGPANVRDGESQYKGYRREWFDDAFARYLSPVERHPKPSQPSQTATKAPETPISQVSQSGCGTDSRGDKSPDSMRRGTGGTDRHLYTDTHAPAPRRGKLTPFPIEAIDDPAEFAKLPKEDQDWLNTPIRINPRGDPFKRAS